MNTDFVIRSDSIGLLVGLWPWRLVTFALSAPYKYYYLLTYLLIYLVGLRDGAWLVAWCMFGVMDPSLNIRHLLHSIVHTIYPVPVPHPSDCLHVLWTSQRFFVSPFSFVYFSSVRVLDLNDSVSF